MTTHRLILLIILVLAARSVNARPGSDDNNHDLSDTGDSSGARHMYSSTAGTVYEPGLIYANLADRYLNSVAPKTVDSTGRYDSPWISRDDRIVSPVTVPAAIQADRQGDSRSSSPYRISRVREGLMFGVAVGGTAVATALATTPATPSPTELSEMSRDAIQWYDRSATYRYSTELIDRSEVAGTTMMLAPLALLLDTRIRSDWQAIGLMYVQTTLLVGASSAIAKESIPRYRPYIYNSELTYEERTAREPGKAFFSSAAAFVFSRAVFLSTVYSDHHPESRLRPYVWGVSLAAAGVTGYLRFASGIHYPSDVVAGALVGSAIGYAVPRLHRAAGKDFAIVPHASRDGIGLQALINW